MHRRASAVHAAIRLTAALCAVAAGTQTPAATGQSTATPMLGATVQIAPAGRYTLARASANGQAALIEQAAAEGQPGPLLIWRAGTAGLTPIPVSGQPLYIGPDGRSILALCGHDALCSWHQGQRRARKRPLAGDCPHPRATANTVLRSSPEARYLLLSCLSIDGQATVVIRLAGGRPVPVATLGGFEGQAIADRGTPIILTRLGATWVDRHGHLRRVARTAPPFAVAQDAGFLAYLAGEGATSARARFVIYDAASAQRRQVEVACPPPALSGPCFQGGSLSGDGRLLELTADAPDRPADGLAALVDAETGALSALSPAAGCEVEGLSADDDQLLYACPSGVFMRAITGG